MPMRAPQIRTSFDYMIPDSIEELLDMLDTYGENCKVIAGGTDLIPKVKAGIMHFKHLISLKNINELKEIRFNPKDGINIGANVPLRVCEADKNIQEHYPALYTGMHSMANTQIRNRGTITGNICNAVPSADTAPALIVYDAKIHIRSKNGGERTIAAEDFFTGVGRTVVEPNELVTSIHIPLPDPDSCSIYYKYTIRKALDLAMIGVASNILVDENKIVKSARIALGAVAIKPVRAYKAEALITGKKLTEGLVEEASRLAGYEDCSPISDIRATAEYRKKMVYVNTRNALRKAAGIYETNS